MPDDFAYMWNIKTKVNKEAKQKQTHRYREHSDGCHMEKELGEWMKRCRDLEQSQGCKVQQRKHSQKYC